MEAGEVVKRQGFAVEDDRLAADLCLDAVWDVRDLRGKDDR